MQVSAQKLTQAPPGYNYPDARLTTFTTFLVDSFPQAIPQAFQAEFRKNDQGEFVGDYTLDPVRGIL